MTELDDYSFANGYITPGETVLWRGKPGKGHLLTGQDVFMIPFSILWCGFAIFWETTAIASGAPFLFGIWGIPFVCVGLYMVFGRFLWAAYIRRRTAYVMTNQKIIRLRGNKIDMLEGRGMPEIHISAFRDGSGTISFGTEYVRMSHRRSYRNPNFFSLENIPDVARVQQYLHSMDH